MDMTAADHSKSSLWPCNTLVLGASGFIGTRLVGHLVNAGCSVRALDIAPPRVRREGVEYICHDVRDDLPARLGDGVDLMYNLAAVHKTPGHPEGAYYQTNIMGALAAARLASKANIKRIVFTSSISVYGPSENLITEDSPLQPESAYGHSKRMAEQIHRDGQAGSPERFLVIVRPGVVFGPGERGNYTHLARALSKGAFFYPGRKDTIKSGGYVDELIWAIGFALDRKKQNILFNFAYPDMPTIEEIVLTFSRTAGFKAAPVIVPAAPLYAAAGFFEIANKVGFRNPIHRQRITKLIRSTRVQPRWLLNEGYSFKTTLEEALMRWRSESNGEFV